MRKLGVVLVVLAICVVGFGFYRGWFALSSPDGGDQVNVNLATDTGKMKEDAAAVKDKAAELTGNVTEGSAEPAERPADEEQPNQLRPDSPDDGQPPRVEPNAAESNRS